ncbi:TIGR02452 family protein [Bernardetia sp.]|uniref:TIGR02452 family protein n=1 Tax=Bernardetia sp. TaxID=1937974 RepID=UPI0025C6D833|nr:TIGR02452 family protein [Bernardetia sp.]
MQKSKRIAIAKDTVKIIEDGFYINQKNKKVDISEIQKYSQLNSELFEEEDNSMLKEHYQPLPNNITKFSTQNESVMVVIDNFLKEKKAPVFCLNFASAKNIGGGFLTGAQAQEESIARVTGLSACCFEFFDEYYQFHRGRKTMLYTDTMIYSPDVPIFKNDEGEYLDTPQKISILTSAAVNAGVVRRQEPKRIDKIIPTMYQRTEKVLAIAHQKGYKYLVLGAWGCGVFQNIPIDIATIFHELLTGKFENCFEEVVFAIKTNQEKIISPFEKYF